MVAERITYSTLLGLRVPTILYLPASPKGKIPALIVVNGHGGDKYAWYATTRESCTHGRAPQF